VGRSGHGASAAAAAAAPEPAGRKHSRRGRGRGCRRWVSPHYPRDREGDVGLRIPVSGVAARGGDTRPEDDGVARGVSRCHAVHEAAMHLMWG
jgi:hypothetical protein